MHRFIPACLGLISVLALPGCGNPSGAVDTANPVQAQPAPVTAPSPSPSPTPSPVTPPIPTSWKPAWGDLTTAKLRPGSKILPSECTVGFLYVDPVQQLYYLGTAAHCTDSADSTTQDGVGTRVVLDDPSTGQNLGEIGTVVFDSDGPLPLTPGVTFNGGGVDFSLILLDPGVNLIANPQEISLQGPTGYLNCADLVAGDLIGFYGHAVIYAAVALESRYGAVVRCTASDSKADIGMPIYGGDSGGPFLHLDSGKAIGHASSGVGFYAAVPTMDYVFRELAAAGFGNVSLATVDGGFIKPE